MERLGVVRFRVEPKISHFSSPSLTQKFFCFPLWEGVLAEPWSVRSAGASPNVSTRHQTRTQCHVPAHVIFSRSVQQLVFSSVLTCVAHACGSSHSGALCSQKHLSSHLAQHGTQYTFSDDSAIIEHFLTSHLHSNPPFDQTVNGTSADFIF